MIKNYFLIIGLLFVFTTAFAQDPYFTEIHYDNCGGDLFCQTDDTNEGIEIAGVPGFELSGWEIVLYKYDWNNDNYIVYNTISLSGVIPSNGVLWTPINEIQDGAFTIIFWEFLNPAGMALVNTNEDPDEVVEFLSYEGSFTASDGPAAGMTSTDIGVRENIRDNSGSLSLQRTDAGWVGPIASTPGEPNQDLTLDVSDESITEFKMYPNPVTRGEFQIAFNDYEHQVEIFSVLGKLVYSKKVKSREAIDVSNLAAGFYMIRVGEEDKMVTRRLLIK